MGGGVESAVPGYQAPRGVVLEASDRHFRFSPKLERHSETSKILPQDVVPGASEEPLRCYMGFPNFMFLAS